MIPGSFGIGRHWGAQKDIECSIHALDLSHRGGRLGVKTGPVFGSILNFWGDLYLLGSFRVKIHA